MLLDKNGLTEEEFLAQYDASRFERPSVTVDVVLFDQNRVLLIRRGGHPFLGKLALPGGFVEPCETVFQAAKRELTEETHVTDIVCKQLPVRSEANRDPRTRVITVPFLAHFIGGVQEARADDDAADARFWSYEVLENGDLLAVTLRNGEETEQFTVRKTLPQGHFPDDAEYTVVGDSPLASDHAAIFAYAWAEEQKYRNLEISS